MKGTSAKEGVKEVDSIVPGKGYFMRVGAKR
jgi:hypothetical protein